MKFAGLILIILCATSVGYERATRLKTQVNVVSEITAMLSEMKIQLNYCNASTQELLNSTALSKKHLSFLKSCIDNYDSGDFSQLWERAVYDAHLPLHDEDIRLLVDFGRGIGTTDLDGQLEMCSAYEERFARRLDFYTAFQKSHSKLYMSFGFFLGLGAAIILI